MDIFDLFAKLSLDSSEYEEGLDSAEERAGSFSSFLAGGFSTAIGVGVAAIASMTAAVAGVSAALGKAVSDTAAYGDEIDKSSQKLGVSSGFYQEWDAVLQHSGTSMDSMTSTFKTLSNAIQDGSKDQQAAFEAIGLSMEDLQGMSTEDAFAATITALQQMEEGTERTALATDLLGKGAMELGPLLNTSAEDTQKMIDTVNELGGVMSEDAVKASARYQDSLQDMQTVFSGLTKSMTAEFLPGFADVMDGITKIFSGDSEGVALIEQGINNIATTVETLLPQVEQIFTQLAPVIGDAIGKALPILLKSAISIVTSIGQGIKNNLGSITSTAIELVGVLGKGLIDMLPEFIKTGVELIASLAMGLAEAAPELIPAITDAILELIMALTDPTTLSLLVDAAIQLMIALAEGIIAALPQLIEAAPVILMNLVTALVENAPLIIEAAAQILTMFGEAFVNLYNTYLAPGIENIKSFLIEKVQEIVSNFIAFFEGIPQWISELPEKLAYGLGLAVGAIVQWVLDMWTAAQEIGPQVIDAIVTFFTELPTNLAEGLASVITAIGTWITDMGTKIAEEVPKVISDFVDFFLELPDKLIEIGGQIVDGLWQGIQDSWDDFVSNVSGIVGSFIEGVKDALGIASPSKVFKQIGRFTAEGFGAGWDDTFADVKEGILNDLDFSATALPALSLSADGEDGLGAGNIYQTINVNQQIATPDELAQAIRLESRYGLMRGVALG